MCCRVYYLNCQSVLNDMAERNQKNKILFKIFRRNALSLNFVMLVSLYCRASALVLCLAKSIDIMLGAQHMRYQHVYAPQEHCGTLFDFILQKTLSPCLPPRLPERPQLPLRYPIISTRKLIDLSDAPTPPPRAVPAPNHSMHFVSNITKNDVATERDFHTSTIRFTEGTDKAKLKLTMSSNQRKVPQPSATLPCNGSAPKFSAPSVGARQSQENRIARAVSRPTVNIPPKGKAQEVTVICAFVIISILYLIIKQKMIAFVP